MALYDTGVPHAADGDVPPNLSPLTADDGEPIDVEEPSASPTTDGTGTPSPSPM